MIKTNKIKIKLSYKNLGRYRLLYGDHLVNGDIIEINITELPISSKEKIIVICDKCGIEKLVSYASYKKYPKENGEYYCSNCKGESIKKGCIRIYGVENVFQLEETKFKTKITCNEKYGHDHHLQNPEILQKQKNTNFERYGVEYQMQLDENKNKSKATCLKKYDVEICSKNQKIKDKAIKTSLLKYETKYPSQAQTTKIKIAETKNKKTMNKFNELNIVSVNKNIYTFHCENGHNFDITSTLLYNRQKIGTVLCTTCNPLNSYSISGMEIQLKDFIQQNYDGSIIFSDRKLIYPHEIDIYLPDLKIAIEFNGVYWHNELNKTNDYHYNKTLECFSKGIQLIHIYEDDWQYKRDIIKSMLLNFLGKSTKMYARKCEIKILKNPEERIFLEHNHIQGYVASNISLGLYYDGKLVSLMSFGKQRKVTGRKSKDGIFELLRFCNDLNTTVVGGASKLFKYFISNYKYDEITTYADRSFSIGNLYKTLGFEYVGETTPNYFYVIDGMRFHRFNFRKDILVKEGYDANKTEHEIMIDRKIYRIYDSGSLKFIYKDYENRQKQMV